MQLPAKYGHIYPHGPGTLGAACDSNRIVSKLLALRFTRCHQRGDDGANVLFGVEHLAEVAKVMRVRRRRQPNLTDAQRSAARDRLARVRDSVDRRTTAARDERAA